jgi:hypothetical protein
MDPFSPTQHKLKFRLRTFSGGMSNARISSAGTVHTQEFDNWHKCNNERSGSNHPINSNGTSFTLADISHAACVSLSTISLLGNAQLVKAFSTVDETNKYRPKYCVPSCYIPCPYSIVTVLADSYKIELEVQKLKDEQTQK